MTAEPNAPLRHRLRVTWLVWLYWPYCAARYKLVAAWRAMHNKNLVVTHDELFALTEGLDEHPESWDGPCCCALCRSYADG